LKRLLVEGDIVVLEEFEDVEGDIVVLGEVEGVALDDF
jgi:hypothetical protein